MLNDVEKRYLDWFIRHLCESAEWEVPDSALTKLRSSNSANIDDMINVLLSCDEGQALNKVPDFCVTRQGGFPRPPSNNIICTWNTNRDLVGVDVCASNGGTYEWIPFWRLGLGFAYYDRDSSGSFLSTPIVYALGGYPWLGYVITGWQRVRFSGTEVGHKSIPQADFGAKRAVTPSTLDEMAHSFGFKSFDEMKELSESEAVKKIRGDIRRLGDKLRKRHQELSETGFVVNPEVREEHQPIGTPPLEDEALARKKEIQRLSRLDNFTL